MKEIRRGGEAQQALENDEKKKKYELNIYELVVMPVKAETKQL